MKMVMAVVKRDLTEPVLASLLKAGFTATFSESRGGMLRQSQNILYVAVDKQHLADVLTIIKGVFHKDSAIDGSPGAAEGIKTSASESNNGNAVLFIWDLDSIEKY